MDEFMQLSNFKKCEHMWRRYMQEHHQVIVPLPHVDSRPRKLLFQIMQDVRDNYAVEDPNIDLHTLNNLSLNLARDVFLKKGRGEVVKEEVRQRVPVVHRDQLQYEGRKTVMGAPRPLSTTRDTSDDSVSDRLTQRTQSKSNNKNDEDNDDEPFALDDTPIDSAEAARRVAERDQDNLLSSILKSVPKPNLKNEANETGKPDQVDDGGSAVLAANERVRGVPRSEGFIDAVPAAAGAGASGSASLGYNSILQNGPSRATTERYIIINGFDRFWRQNPLRYQYSVSVGGNVTDLENKNLQSRYRNVQSLQVTRLVIPMEIVPRTTFKGPGTGATCLNTSAPTLSTLKGAYRHAASLSFQYVMLCLDGFNDIYDGTNDASRSAFCQLVYSTSYQAPNGRGFVVMKPMQGEKKVFSPSPLASLNRLSISILRPSGALFNNSTDDQMIDKLQYEPFNRLYIRVCVVNHFDMNEFFAGDSVIIQNYKAVQPAARAGNAWSPNTSASYAKLNGFINRPEGHEIVELGLANDAGFFQSFCIMAPAVFDAVNGAMVVDASSIAAIVETIQPTFPCPCDGFGGALLNMSLQSVVTFKIMVLDADAQSGFAV